MITDQKESERISQLEEDTGFQRSPDLPVIRNEPFEPQTGRKGNLTAEVTEKAFEGLIGSLLLVSGKLSVVLLKAGGKVMTHSCPLRISALF